MNRLEAVLSAMSGAKIGNVDWNLNDRFHFSESHGFMFNDELAPKINLLPDNNRYYVRPSYESIADFEKNVYKKKLKEAETKKELLKVSLFISVTLLLIALGVICAK